MLIFKRILFTLCFLLLAFPLKAAEYIEDFHTDIMVNPNGSLNIEETITIHHEGDQIKRGIYRDLSITKGESYKILSVMRNGSPEPWFLEYQSSKIRLNTGNDELLNSPATSIYTINYIMYDALRPIKDENLNELYLNVSGKWNFPINHLTAEVHYPDNTGVIRQYGYQTNHQRQDYTPDKPFEFFNIFPYEEVTIAQAFTKGTVNIPYPKTYRILITSLILMLIYYIIAWRIWGKDPTPKAIVPDWEIPRDLSPLECAFINQNGEAPKNSFFIHIMWLLQQHIIKILENKTSGLIGQKTMYTLTTLSETQTSSPEIELYKKNFPNVLTLTASPSDRLARYQTALTNLISIKLEKLYYRKRNILTTIGALFTPMACLYLFPETFGMLVWTFLVIAAPAIYSKNLWPLLILSVLLSPTLYFYLQTGEQLIWPITFFSYFILIIIFKHLMFQPTFLGQRKKEKIEGLKMFLKAVSVIPSKKEISDEQPVDNTPLSTEKRLTPKDMDNLFPYAVALGLEKEWSKKFETIFGTATLAQTTNALWYQPNFQTNFASCCKNATIPPRSGSGLSSSGIGSHGGGFAGGGFGGGGGGGR